MLDFVENSSNILSMIPERELDFVLKKSSDILSKSNGGNLESILQLTAASLKDLEFGWEEAILSGNWYRWPSQLKNQCFCSEKALDTFLTLRALRIPVWYGVLEGFQGSDMTHEAIFVPTKDRLYALHFNSALEVKIEDGSLVFPKLTGEARSITFDTMTFLNEDEVIDRVYRLQTGDRFLAAVESGQILFTKEGAEGCTIGSVHYDPARKEISFRFVYSPDSGLGLQPYIEYKSFEENGTIFQETNMGICEQDGYSPTDWKVFCTARGTGLATQRLYDSLTEEQKMEMVWQANYHLFTSNGGYGCEETALQTTLHRIRTNAKNSSCESQLYFQDVASVYDGFFNSGKTEKAKRFLDHFTFFHIRPCFFDNSIDAEQYMAENYDLTTSGIESVFMLHSTREIGAIISRESAIACNNRLTEELANQTGIPFRGSNYNHFLYVAEEWGKQSKKEFASL